MGTRGSVAVWLICSDGPQAGKVLLQQRAETQVRIEAVVRLKRVEKSQSNPYICQPTWNGKIEEGEGVAEAIRREAREELGSEFADSFDFGSLHLFHLQEYFQTCLVFNFLGSVSQRQLDLVKLHSGAMPEFVAVDSKDWTEIRIAGTPGTDPKTQIVLFGDQYQALRKLFSIKETLVHLR